MLDLDQLLPIFNSDSAENSTSPPLAARCPDQSDDQIQYFQIDFQIP